MTDVGYLNLKPRPFKSARSILALVLREMSTTYGRSPGGYLWAIVEPVGAIAVLSFAFQLIFRTPPIGTNFPLYFATGMMPYTMAMDIEKKTNSAIRFSNSLLFYPAVKYTDAIFARVLLAVLTHVIVIALIIGGIHIVFGLSSIVTYTHVLNSLGMATAFGLGLGMLNCVLHHASSLWKNVWKIITRPLVIMSGVILFYDHLPEQLRYWLWFNPLLHIVTEMRTAFYPTYNADWVSPGYVMFVSCCLTAFGLLLLKRHHKSMIND